MGDTADEQQPAAIEPGAAGAPEGAVAEASTDDVKKMYDDLGIKAPVPTGKPKGRPKTDDGGDKKTSKKDDASGKSEKGRASDDSKDKSKTSSSSDSDGSDGNDADASGKKSSQKSGKDGEEDSKVSSDGDKDAKGVSKSESSDNGKTAKSGEDDAEDGDDGTGKDAGESSDASKQGEEDENSEGEKGKRPGKSNPEVEKRFQKLTSDVKERDQVIADLQKKLQATTQKQVQERIAQEDPEYTVDDFRKVRDNKTGEIIDLDPEKAELAWRRWKDGYDQRATERDARANYEANRVQQAEATTRQLMKDSADAYDALASLMDEYPELVSTSDKFDEDFAADAMPIIEEAVQYLPGTEPGNKEDKLPIIVGLKIDPKKILTAMRGISNKKRNLPLNGVNDNVESGSSVSVPHSRSSDPTVNAANDLYKELGINKRI